MIKISSFIGFMILIFTSICCEEETQFEKIEFDWKIDVIESIGKNLNPDEKYNYWVLLRSDDGGHERVDILQEQGELDKRNLIDLTYNPNGFIVGGHHSNRAYYILAIENDKVFEIRNTEDLLTFLGEIDTMEEALLITKLNGFGIDYCDEQGGSYRKEKNFYEFYLFKSNSTGSMVFLDWLENTQYLVSVNSAGMLNSESCGIYCQGTKKCLCL